MIPALAGITEAYTRNSSFQNRHHPPSQPSTLLREGKEGVNQRYPFLGITEGSEAESQDATAGRTHGGPVSNAMAHHPSDPSFA